VRRAHAWEGRPLELTGWMHRHGRLELLVALPDGTRLLVPAAWTDLQASTEPPLAGTLASLEDLLAARRMLDPVLERVVVAERDDAVSEEIDRAAASRTGRESGAGGGVVGVARRAAAPDRDELAGGDDRADDRARAGRGGRR
jgi:DNA-binding FadR family transcriptional regulator